MISSYNNSTQTVLTNGTVPFATDRIKTGCTVSHPAGSAVFTLNRPGFYYVAVNADITTSDAAGNVALALQQNGTAIPGAGATAYAAATTNVANLAFSTIVQVRPNCCAVSNTTNIQLVNTGVGSTITNANIVITKLA